MKTCVCTKTKNYANFFLQQLQLLAPGITALWNAAPREICHQHKLTIDNIFTEKIQYFRCHFHHNWPYIYNFGFDQSDNTYYAFIIIGKVYHSTLTFSMLSKKCIILLSLLLSPWLHSSSFETSLRPKMGLVLRENCPMKTNPGSKTQSGLNNGIFFHSKLPFTTSFPLFLRQKREGWPISQLSHKDKRSEAHNFSSLDRVKRYNPKIWNISIQFPEVGRILTHFPLYQASIFSIESHPIQFSGSLLIPISSILESCNPTYLNPTSLNNSKVCQTFHHF